MEILLQNVVCVPNLLHYPIPFTGTRKTGYDTDIEYSSHDKINGISKIVQKDSKIAKLLILLACTWKQVYVVQYISQGLGNI